MRMSSASGRPGEVAVLAHRCLEDLEHVEAGIFPKQGVAQQPDHLIVVTALEHVGDHLSRLVDTLLAVELAEERVAGVVAAAAGQGRALLRHVEEALEVDGHGAVKHAAGEFRRRRRGEAPGPRRSCR